MGFILTLALMMGAVGPGDDTPTAGRSWIACSIQSARKFSSSTESASVIAEAVMSDCATQEQYAKRELFALQLKAYQHQRGDISQVVASAEAATDKAMEDMRRNVRGMIIGIVLEERAKPTEQSTPR